MSPNDVQKERRTGTALDLEHLRSAAARQMSSAVYHYFTASREVLNEPFAEGITYQEKFAREAADEMEHYLWELRQVSRLDPTQREEFETHGLGPYLVQDQEPPLRFWYGPYFYPPQERTRRWLKTIENVVEAIDFELETINTYQAFISQTADPEVRQVFQKAMDHEKDDLAVFNQMFFKLLGQPRRIPDQDRMRHAAPRPPAGWK